ncbi:MAG: hypothetical protein HY618_06270 [Candidatus Tectomicrobia bacterium]|uniref:Extradiol ring-cleavage dioxygenase class III enzyme subunit B domain-containing protein n=1 Tax=Tectimicrobiota bacterium TaxID=2528274 RepID=A0A932ZV59_UNCTE|nr:hypothetical protein [Candidatus Tectomicrobia bacterium]
MAGIELGYLAPHPWIMVAGEREAGHHAATTTAFRRAAGEVARRGVDLLLVASPHWPPAASFRVGGAPRYAGTLDAFLPHVNAALPPAHRRDLPPVPYDFPGEPELAARLLDAGREAGLPVQLEPRPEALDHGSIVPILYLNPEGRLPVLLLSVQEGPAARSRAWGEIVAREAGRLGRRAAFVASGTLSHRFLFDRPNALWPEGEAWDRRVLEALTGGSPEAVLGYTEAEVAAGQVEEGGLHGLFTLLGALGPGARGSVLSYEGIVGVGSPIVRFEAAPKAA